MEKQRAASEALGQFHVAVTQYLSGQLAHVSTIQAFMQQRRVDAQRQRYEKFADSAKQTTNNTKEQAELEDDLKGVVGALDDRGRDVADQLDTEQLQSFEQEATDLVRSLRADLAAVQHAEQQLQDISSLQSKILHHMEEQNEQIDTLRTDAGVHGEQVTRGNQQLRQAKERNRRANRMLSVFFVVSGLVLLFMHCESLDNSS